MKTNKKALHQQRQILDQKPSSSRPKKGWIRSVRNALGLSEKTLAERMGLAQANIHRLEMNEQKDSITLGSLRKAAENMDCELIYMFVPKAPYKSFDEILDRRALDLASRIAKGVSHSMTLEDQKVSEKITDYQIQNLASELKQKLDMRLWTDLPLKKKK